MPETKDTDREKALPASERAEVQNAHATDPDVELAMTETISDVDNVVFSALKGIRRYQIVRAPKEKLEEWKRGVDEIASAIAAKNLVQVKSLMKKEACPLSSHLLLNILYIQKTL